MILSRFGEWADTSWASPVWLQSLRLAWIEIVAKYYEGSRTSLPTYVACIELQGLLCCDVFWTQISQSYTRLGPLKDAQLTELPRRRSVHSKLEMCCSAKTCSCIQVHSPDGWIFFLPPMLRRVLSPSQSELHQTGIFEGPSTDWATAPRLGPSKPEMCCSTNCKTKS